jgi:GT2 family glycosyltransferase
LTASCLDALEATIAHRRNEGEIIVVDDASTDETPSALKARRDVDVAIRHEQNTGFQGAATDGADAARGDVLIFLNNDTTPQPGWLDALLAQLDEPNVGIAGAMFLFPDGTVQEFGGIVWRDASAYHIGARRDPADPLFSRARDVDYVSGAGMAIRKAFWNAIGGFDPELKPAYYEDTDLCMKVRAAGKRVVVTPHSKIVHIMGGSKDVDPRKSHDTMMSVNRRKFHEKWKPVLDREHWPPHAYFIDVASDRGKPARKAPPPIDPQKKRLLFLYAIVPQFDRQSGDRRLFEMMLAYRDLGHAVTLLSLVPDEVQAAMLIEAGIDVWHGDKAEFLSDNPTSTIEHHLKDGRFDIVYFGSPQIARLYMGLIRSVLPGVQIVTDAIDLTYHRLHRDRLLNDPESLVTLPLDCDWELETYAASDALTSISDEELAMLRASGLSVPVEIVSNFYSSAIKPEPFEGRSGIVIVVNMAHHPNLDALQWFIGEVWSKVLALNPSIRLTICGNGTEALQINGVSNVSVTGYLPSMDPVFRHARVNVAPLRVGAGVKGKVTEAMRNGLPTVTTPIGAEGLGEDGKQAVLVEADPERFAVAIVAAHDDEGLWTRLSRGAVAAAERRFSRDASMPALMRLLDHRWKAYHSAQHPTIVEIDAAFADPEVACATFAAAENAEDLVRLLRSEPCVGAIVGGCAAQLTFDTLVDAPALVVSRAAYQLANIRGKCSALSDFVSRFREHGLALATTTLLPAAALAPGAGRILVDLTVRADAAPARVAAIANAIKRAGDCRLRIVPRADLTSEVPGAVEAPPSIEGPADVSVFDGKVVAPMVLGSVSPLGLAKKVSLSVLETIEERDVETFVRTWAENRIFLTVSVESQADIVKFANVVGTKLKDRVARAVLVAKGARSMQLAWACGLTVTQAFREIPPRVAGSTYVYAVSSNDLETVLNSREDLVVESGNLLGARVRAVNPVRFSNKEELLETFPAWMRATKMPEARLRTQGKPTVLFILGMHRSGTSLLAALLGALGVRLSDDLMPGNAFNERGYYESQSIAAIHDEILGALDSSWSTSTTLNPLPNQWWKQPEIRGLKEQLKTIVRRQAHSDPATVWGFKDPRTARLLPLWDEIIAELDLDARYVLSVRDAREVAGSLSAREGMTQTLSELLWLEHNAGAIEYLGDRLHAIVRYEQWFEDPLSGARELIGRLGFEVPDENALKSAVQALVSSDLRHQRAIDSPFSLPFTRELYDAIRVNDVSSVQTLANLFNVNAVFTQRVLSLRPQVSAGGSDASTANAPARDVIVHYHMFKNAGTSIDQILSESLSDRWIGWDPGDGDGVFSAHALAAFARSRPGARAISSHVVRPPVPVMQGITFHPIVVLRHPILRAASVYKHDRRQSGNTEAERIARDGDFAHYVRWRLNSELRGVISNFQTVHLSGEQIASGQRSEPLVVSPEIYERAQTFLSELPVFGLVERFGESLQLFAQYFEPLFPEIRWIEVQANTTDSTLNTLEDIRHALGAELYAELEHANRFDLQLYEYGAARFTRSLSLYANSQAATSAETRLPSAIHADVIEA